MDQQEKEFTFRGGQGQVVDPETFRDTVNTMDQSGKRKWVFPRKPKGRYTNYRLLVSIFLLAVFFVLPFIKINGNPFLLLNILDREFYIFGQPFYPQDFFILALGAITSIVFIILFTVVFGRIFCGWICPQTIFMEMIFRKIEYAIEGDRNKQIRLDNQPWDAEKIWKRGLKWTIFLLVSLIITHFMFMYIVGYEEVFRITLEDYENKLADGRISVDDNKFRSDSMKYMSRKIDVFELCQLDWRLRDNRPLIESFKQQGFDCLQQNGLYRNTLSEDSRF